MADVLPDEDAVLQTIHARVFRQGLVEAAHWGQKNYGIDTVKVGAPGVSLSPDHISPVRQHEVAKRWNATYRCPRATDII